ncbi:hypothetical protein C8J57DRAFT_1478782 [Mycena rebaudengoi]|nr:hypothetical protein C8J57DRAFT_1478782 [Mycena rebaudengoi]
MAGMLACRGLAATGKTMSGLVEWFSDYTTGRIIHPQHKERCCDVESEGGEGAGTPELNRWDRAHCYTLVWRVVASAGQTSRRRHVRWVNGKPGARQVDERAGRDEERGRRTDGRRWSAARSSGSRVEGGRTNSPSARVYIYIRASVISGEKDAVHAGHPRSKLFGEGARMRGSSMPGYESVQPQRLPATLVEAALLMQSGSTSARAAPRAHSHHRRAAGGAYHCRVAKAAGTNDKGTPLADGGIARQWGTIETGWDSGRGKESRGARQKHRGEYGQKLTRCQGVGSGMLGAGASEELGAREAYRSSARVLSVSVLLQAGRNDEWMYAKEKKESMRRRRKRKRYMNEYVSVGVGGAGGQWNGGVTCKWNVERWSNPPIGSLAAQYTYTYTYPWQACVRKHGADWHRRLREWGELRERGRGDGTCGACDGTASPTPDSTAPNLQRAVAVVASTVSSCARVGWRAAGADAACVAAYTVGAVCAAAGAPVAGVAVPGDVRALCTPHRPAYPPSSSYASVLRLRLLRLLLRPVRVRRGVGRDNAHPAHPSRLLCGPGARVAAAALRVAAAARGMMVGVLGRSAGGTVDMRELGGPTISPSPSSDSRLSSSAVDAGEEKYIIGRRQRRWCRCEVGGALRVGGALYPSSSSSSSSSEVDSSKAEHYSDVVELEDVDADDTGDEARVEAENKKNPPAAPCPAPAPPRYSCLAVSVRGVAPSVVYCVAAYCGVGEEVPGAVVYGYPTLPPLLLFPLLRRLPLPTQRHRTKPFQRRIRRTPPTHTRRPDKYCALPPEYGVCTVDTERCEGVTALPRLVYGATQYAGPHSASCGRTWNRNWTWHWRWRTG